MHTQQTQEDFQCCMRSFGDMRQPLSSYADSVHVLMHRIVMLYNLLTRIMSVPFNQGESLYKELGFYG